jgi:hypothetical protein
VLLADEQTNETATTDDKSATYKMKAQNEKPLLKSDLA